VRHSFRVRSCCDNSVLSLKGIVEVADAIVVNKSDGELEK